MTGARYKLSIILVLTQYYLRYDWGKVLTQYLLSTNAGMTGARYKLSIISVLTQYYLRYDWGKVQTQYYLSTNSVLS